jgi:RND family efflux transporter MFP subunit
MKISMKILPALLAAGILLSAAARAQTEVKTAPPAVSDKTSKFQIPGRTEPVEAATIFTRATGIVKERHFEIGQQVAEGDILATIDTPEIDRALEAAKANVEQARARAANAVSLSSRASRLLKSSVVSKEETEQRETDAVGAAAAVRVAEAELARLAEQQRFSTVRAPFSGVISARNLDRGDLARGDASQADGWLYRLARIDTLRFVVGASPDLALRLASGTPATLRFKEFPGREFTATVANSSRVFDTSSGTMRVELLLDNKDLLLPAGLTGTAVFQLPPPENTFLIPNNAILVREGLPRLALAEAGKVRFLEIAVGRNLGKVTEVASAELTPASQIILNPNAMLREGDLVSASPAPSAPQN